MSIIASYQRDHRGGDVAVIGLNSCGLRLSVGLRGASDAPNRILLVHGWRDHGRMWDAAAKRLAEDHLVASLDLRGHGDSDWSPDHDYSMTALLADIDAAVGALMDEDGKPVRLLAHSLGADLAMRYAAIFPEKVERLLAVEGLGIMSAGLDKQLKLSIDKRQRRMIAAKSAPRRLSILADRDEAIARYRAVHPRFSSDLVTLFVEHGLRPEGDGWCWKADPVMYPTHDMTRERSELRGLWPRIKCPLMHLTGGRSKFPDPQRDGLDRYFPAAEYRVFPDAGHWPQHDEPEAFDGLLREFYGSGGTVQRKDVSTRPMGGV